MCGLRIQFKKLWGISSVGRALASQVKGRRFDPDILHQKGTLPSRKFSFCVCVLRGTISFCGKTANIF